MKNDNTTASSVECCGVVCEPLRLVEVEGGRAAVSVLRQDIKRITLRNGLRAPHPVIQFCAGLLLLSVAYFPAAHLIHWLRYGGTLFSLELWVIAVSVIGVWLIATAFRRGHFLEVESAQGVKRLLFHGSPEQSLVDAFVKVVEQQYELRVEKW